MAGLTAAHELAQKGFTSVLIVEAQDYVGGRVKTGTQFGDPVELGAEFVHGKNIVTWDYLRQATIVAEPRGGFWKLVQKDGHQISAAEHEQYASLKERVEANGRPGVSIAALIDELRGDATDDVVKLLKFSAGDYEAGDAESLDSGAYTAMCRLTEHNGGNYVITHGYRQLVDFLASGAAIRTSAVVEAIDTSEAQAKVTLQNGDVLRAKRVVVTVSIGVLQHHGVRFVPALPRDVTQAINRIGMGRVVKYLLEFHTGSLVEHLFHVSDGENESLQTVSCWWQSASNPKVLVGYAGGSRHDAIVAMDDTTLLHKTLRDLGTIIGRDISSELKNQLLVRWDTNPYIRGAYSNHPVGVSNEERAVFARPLGNLFFAGEATVTSGNYATVHGAIESGRRAAEQVAASLL